MSARRPDRRQSTDELSVSDPPPDLSIVLPAHNEAENIAPMVAALKEVAAPLGAIEIIFVDDGSHDGTLAALRAAAAAESGGPLCVLHPQFRSPGGAARGAAPRARPRRGGDGCRFRASAGADPASSSPRGATASRSWRRSANDDGAVCRRSSASARGSIIACSTPSATFTSSPAAPTTCCSTASWSMW